METDEGYTPLGIAAEKGNEQIIALLLQAGANVNQIMRVGDCTVLLHWLCVF